MSVLIPGWIGESTTKNRHAPGMTRVSAARHHRNLAKLVDSGANGAAQRGGRPLSLTVLMVVLFLTFLDNTVVSVALGSVQSTLHAGVTALQWVVSSMR
jgi:hypothetical protein